MVAKRDLASSHSDFKVQTYTVMQLIQYFLPAGNSVIKCSELMLNLIELKEISYKCAYYITSKLTEYTRIYIYIYRERERERERESAAFNVTHFESRITHLLYTAINTTEHG